MYAIRITAPVLSKPIYLARGGHVAATSQDPRHAKVWKTAVGAEGWAAETMRMAAEYTGRSGAPADGENAREYAVRWVARHSATLEVVRMHTLHGKPLCLV